MAKTAVLSPSFILLETGKYPRTFAESSQHQHDHVRHAHGMLATVSSNGASRLEAKTLRTKIRCFRMRTVGVSRAVYV